MGAGTARLARVRNHAPASSVARVRAANICGGLVANLGAATQDLELFGQRGENMNLRRALVYRHSTVVAAAAAQSVDAASKIRQSPA